MIRILVAALAAAAMTTAAHAAAAPASGDGYWHGVLTTPGGALRLVLKLAPGPGGHDTGVLTSVDQGATPIPIADVQRTAGSLSFAVPAIHGRYEGAWNAARHEWRGTWTQGASLPLTLSAGDLPHLAPVPGLDGVWTGALPTPAGGQLRLVLRVANTAYGSVAVLDSPDQLAKGIPVAGLVREGAAVRFTVPAVNGAWSGTLGADGRTLVGTWTQGADSPLTFTHSITPTAHKRPQTPQPPFPYRSEAVSVPSAPGVMLAGTLTLPPGKGPFPAAVLITGSGPQDRDETLLGHKPFAVLADELTRRGVAVLRLDDRGVGDSTGDFSKAVTADFAVDAEAAAAFLRARRDIDARKVGLIGHSEGGVVAPMVAQRDPKIAFLVLMAGPAAPMDQLLDAQRLALAPGFGLSDTQARQLNVAFDAAVKAMQGAANSAEAEGRARTALAAVTPPLPARQIDAMVRQLSTDWWRQLMAYDPGPALRSLRAPVLAVNGSKDRQVPPEQNLPLMRAALKDDRDATVLELPGLNHLFQTAPTGAVGEYEDIEETIAPSALQVIGDWVVAHTR